MKLNKLEILKAFDAINAPYEARDNILSLALARVIAYLQPLPTSVVMGSISDFYNENILSCVERMVYDINESIPLKTDYVLAATYRIYAFRYKAAFSVFSGPTHTFLDALLRAGESSLTADQTDLLTRYGEDRDLINIFTRAIMDRATYGEVEAPVEQSPVTAAAVVEGEESGSEVAGALPNVQPNVEGACVCPSQECHVHGGQGGA